MPDLLIELFSEEIPARMQAQAAKDFERLIVGALSDRGLLFEGVKSFAGPRRLTLAIDGLPVKQPDVSEERKGPRTNAPEKALEGFLRSAGVTLEQCQKQSDAKGEFYVAVDRAQGPRDGGGDCRDRARSHGQAALAEIDALASGHAFDTSKSALLGGALLGKTLLGSPGTRNEFSWVRPLHSIFVPSTAKWCRSNSRA